MKHREVRNHSFSQKNILYYFSTLSLKKWRFLFLFLFYFFLIIVFILFDLTNICITVHDVQSCVSNICFINIHTNEILRPWWKYLRNVSMFICTFCFTDFSPIHWQSSFFLDKIVTREWDFSTFKKESFTMRVIRVMKNLVSYEILLRARQITWGSVTYLFPLSLIFFDIGSLPADFSLVHI